MVRGHAKEQAQAKNAAAKAKAEKSGTQLGAADAAMKFECHVCKQVMPGPVLLKEHYESKHPKETVPPFCLEACAAAEAKKKAAADAKKGGGAAAGGDAKPKKKKKDDDLSALLDAGLAGVGKKK